MASEREGVLIPTVEGLEAMARDEQFIEAAARLACLMTGGKPDQTAFGIPCWEAFRFNVTVGMAIAIEVARYDR